MARGGHVWSSWGPWQEVPGTGQEMRERHCLDATCGETETEWRNIPPPKPKKK